MWVSSSIRYCWRVVGRSSRPRVLRPSSHWSPYALIVGIARREAPRAAVSGAQTSIWISARRLASQATASSLASKVVGAR